MLAAAVLTVATVSEVRPMPHIEAETTEQKLCAQCEANARWNEAGGYHELAEQCREYCRRGHKEPSDDH